MFESYLKETPVLTGIFYFLHGCSSLFSVKVSPVNNWKILHFYIFLSLSHF